VTRVTADDGTRISIATFRALNKRGLVDWDTSTSLVHGQRITVTEHGRQALVKPRPAATATTPRKPSPGLLRCRERAGANPTRSRR
jgi:hypothetical protein